MSFHVGDPVVVNKNIHRFERSANAFKLYAPKGTAGKILEIFRVRQSGTDWVTHTYTLHAKVLTKGTILTFRLTSLDRVIIFDSLT